MHVQASATSYSFSIKNTTKKIFDATAVRSQIFFYRCHFQNESLCVANKAFPWDRHKSVNDKKWVRQRFKASTEFTAYGDCLYIRLRIVFTEDGRLMCQRLKSGVARVRNSVPNELEKVKKVTATKSLFISAHERSFDSKH